MPHSREVCFFFRFQLPKFSILPDACRHHSETHAERHLDRFDTEAARNRLWFPELAGVYLLWCPAPERVGDIGRCCHEINGRTLDVFRLSVYHQSVFSAAAAGFGGITGMRIASGAAAAVTGFFPLWFNLFGHVAKYPPFRFLATSIGVLQVVQSSAISRSP